MIFFLRNLTQFCLAFLVLSLFAFGAEAEQKLSKQNDEKVLLFIGDSLTAGYGVKKEEAFPERIESMLRKAGRKVKVINGGISGSVTADADRRVKWFLKAKPSVLFLCLGGNDGRKGTPPAVIEKNLDQAIELAKKNKVPVVLSGMKMLTNLGPDYGRDFEAVYARLAKKHGLVFDPFLLEGVAMKKELNQTDMLHPNAAGHEAIAKRLLPLLEKQL